jgi:alpha-tubulin suppressor-like RCC1 family protein
MREIYGTVACIVVCATGCSDMGPARYEGASRRLAVGEATACALDDGGAVYCWGANTIRWEYGAPPSAIPASSVPVLVPVPRLATLAAGVGTHFCGIAEDARAVCWGRGGFGQLGGGTPGDSGNVATTVTGGIRWRELAVGRLDTCGISFDHRGFCWGANQRGEIGVAFVSLEELTTSPIEVDGNLRFSQIVPGWTHACSITTSAETYCWGAADAGQVGVPPPLDDVNVRNPSLVSSSAFVQIAVGARHSCGVTADGVAYCWGSNAVGQLGDGTRTTRLVPMPVLTSQRFASIAVASGFAGGSNAPVPPPLTVGTVAHTCALTNSGLAYCWGWNANGQLGDGTNIDRLVPVPVSGSGIFTTIGLGGSYTCGMRGNGVWCWGANASGQLGAGPTGTASATPAPVRAPFDTP